MLKGRFKRVFIIGTLILLAVGAVATWKYFSGRASSNRLVLSGTIEADEIHIGSKVGGRISEVLVKEGEEVRAGQPMIRFEAYDLQAKKNDAVAAINQAEAGLEKMKNWTRPEELAEARARAEAAWMSLELARNGPRKQEIDQARAEVEAARADYQVAKTTLARIEQLVKNGVQSRQEYDNAKAAYDRAEARLKSVDERLSLLVAGTRPEEIARAEREYRQAKAGLELVERGARREDIRAAEAQLERQRAALQQIETQFAELEVKAPADAYVEVFQVRPGDLINPGSPVATLVELDRLWVRVYVPEPELGHAQLGEEVSVTVDTFAGESFKGRIEQIASKGEFTPRNVQTRDEREHQVFAVRVRLDNSNRHLRAGMAADVTIAK